MAVLLAVAIWSRHNHKVSTSVLRSNGPHALDGSRVGRLWFVNDEVQVLVGRTIVIESALVLVLVLVLIVLLVIVLAAQTLGRARPGPRRITATGSGHARNQVLMTVPGIFWTERSSIGVGNKLVFTFTSRRCGRQGPWNCLLARLCCTRARSSVLLAMIHCRERVDFGDGSSLGNGGLGGRVGALSLETCLHLPNACFESLKLRGLRLNILLSVARAIQSARLSSARAARKKRCRLWRRAQIEVVWVSQWRGLVAGDITSSFLVGLHTARQS